MSIQINHKTLTLEELKSIFDEGDHLEISPETRGLIQKSRSFLEEKIRRSPKPIYGINTGFGDLCKETIADKDLEALQLNLIRSHACGVGREVPERMSRLMILLKIKSFCTGHSAISADLMERVLHLFNSGAAPVVFEQGSLGASGDLVPLAHLFLPLIGEGELKWKATTLSGAEFLKKQNLKPLQLKAKEGLALLNGTQLMLAYGIDSIWRARNLMHATTTICALAMDVFDCRTDFLHPAIHAIRPHKGQQTVAAIIKNLLADSEIANREKIQVQDPYSVRCIPQVLGASLDTISYVASVLETELNSITDNPLVFEELDLVISGGNFHGQPLALALDFLAIAVAEMGNISERLLYQLISGQRGLPIYLTTNAGLESGFMIPQYSAASLVSQNKQLCTPASVDSIVSSNGQEDHVSMGANAATKCAQILENVESVIGILLLSSAQALEFRRPLKSGSALEKMVADFRKKVPFRSSDLYFKPDMDAALSFVKEFNVEKYQV